MKIAQDFAAKAISQTEQACAKANLASFENADLAQVIRLAAQWDTLGWIYFKGGDIARAEKYVDASWQLSQHADVADHLGQVYEKQGKHDAAIHMWRLALASNSQGIEDVQFIGGLDSLKNAAHAIQTAKYPVAFPDGGPEKIIRRGILSCSNYTRPSCQLTLLLPSTVRRGSESN